MTKITSTDWGKNRFNDFIVTNHTNHVGAYNLPNETHSTAHGPSPQISITLLYISDSKFTDNIGGGVNIELYMGYSNTIYQVIIRNCSFQKNQTPIGSGLKIGQPSVLPRISGLEVLVQSTKFMYDTVMPEIYDSDGLNVIAVYRLTNFQIINCTFAMNKQTALQAFDSTL